MQWLLLRLKSQSAKEDIFQYWCCELCVENQWGGRRKHCFENCCSLAVLESSMDEGWWSGKSCSERAEIVSFSSRSGRSYPQMFFKIGVPQACSFIKIRLQHRCFSVKLAKSLRTHFFKEHLRWLLLYILYTHDIICNLSRWNNGYNISKKDQWKLNTMI